MLFEDDVFDYSDLSMYSDTILPMDMTSTIVSALVNVAIDIGKEKLKEYIKTHFLGNKSNKKTIEDNSQICVASADSVEDIKEIATNDTISTIETDNSEDTQYCCIYCHAPIKTEYDFCPNCQRMTIHGLQHKAEQGNIDSIKELSYLLVNGIGVTQDIQNGIGLCFEAARLGDAEAQYDMGHFYETGVAFSELPQPEAFKWYLKSAEQGHSAAQVKVGLCYKNGTGIQQNDKLAFEWWLKAANCGNKVAQRNVGYCYGKSIGIQQDAEKAIEWFEKAAMQGDSEAQYYLGLFYCNGIGCPQNYAKGIKWLLSAGEMDYEKALQELKKWLGTSRSFEILSELFGLAGKNDAESQYVLAKFYQEGVFLPQDSAKAVELFGKAAEQNNSDAQFALGSSYYSGAGVPEDTEKAIELFENAAQQGNVNAQYALGSCYLLGIGRHKNFNKAKELLEQAADYGSAEAQYRLGSCYYTGNDTFPSDYVKAAKYFYVSAMQGYAEAQLILGIFYFAGYGVMPSNEKCKAWLEKAAKQGNQDAIDFLKQLQ